MTRPFRAVHFISSIHPKAGGTVEALMQLVSCADEATLTHEIVSLDRPENIESLYRGVRIYSLGPPRNFYGYTKRLDKWLAKHLKDYDIAIIHGCWQYHGLATFRACKKQNIPYIQYTHGMLDPWFKQQYPLKHLKKWLYWPWAEYRILKHARRVIFTTQEERDLASKSFWLYKVNPEIIPLGISPPNFDLPSCVEQWKAFKPELKACRYLIFLSRIHEKKGLDDLIEAIERINQTPEMPWDDPLALVIAGPCNDKAFLENLQNKALGISLDGPINQILWVDMIRDELKWGALAGAEAFILPSHQENFGMVVPESLACSTPVLISNKVNIWREVETHNAGLVEPDGVEGTEQLLMRWLSKTPEEKQFFRVRANEAFQNEFVMQGNARRVFERLLSLIKNAHESNKAKSV